MTTGVPVSLRFSVWAFLCLARPMLNSRAGLAAMDIADGVMIRRYQSREFAWLSQAEGTLGRLLDVFVPLLIRALSVAPGGLALGLGMGVRGLFLAMLMAGAMRTILIVGRLRFRTRAAGLEFECQMS